MLHRAVGSASGNRRVDDRGAGAQEVHQERDENGRHSARHRPHDTQRAVRGHHGSQREREEVYARVKAAEAALRQARAREAHAREDFAQVQRDRKRAEQLAKSGVISAQALEQTRNADITAGEELSAAESGVQVAASEEKIARAGLVGIEAKAGSPAPLIELRSPRSSRVLRVLEKSERVVPMGTPILILGDSADIEIVTEVLSTDAVKIAAGSPV